MLGIDIDRAAFPSVALPSHRRETEITCNVAEGAIYTVMAIDTTLSIITAKGVVTEVAEAGIRRLAGRLVFTKTTAAHMANPGRYVPRHILAHAIKHGKRLPDPQGAEGAVKIVVELERTTATMTKCGLKTKVSKQTLEIIYRESTNEILHFMPMSM